MGCRKKERKKKTLSIHRVVVVYTVQCRNRNTKIDILLEKISNTFEPLALDFEANIRFNDKFSPRMFFFWFSSFGLQERDMHLCRLHGNRLLLYLSIEINKHTKSVDDLVMYTQHRAQHRHTYDWNNHSTKQAFVVCNICLHAFTRLTRENVKRFQWLVVYYAFSFAALYLHLFHCHSQNWGSALGPSVSHRYTKYEWQRLILFHFITALVNYCFFFVAHSCVRVLRSHQTQKSNAWK